MAKAKEYTPMLGSNNRNNRNNRMPKRVLRCVDSKGKHVVVRQYVYRARNRQDEFTIKDDDLREPACHMLSVDNKIRLNVDYKVQMINYYLSKKNINEYVLRGMIIEYLRGKKKIMGKGRFKDVCGVFDKADKMLSRCDVRKNDSIKEADVSYGFLIKSYVKIMGMCEGGAEKGVLKDVVGGGVKVDIATKIMADNLTPKIYEGWELMQRLTRDRAIYFKSI